MVDHRPVVPLSLWKRPEVQAALANRDVATLLKLARRHSGASQTRIGELLKGVTQAEISNIERGKRVVPDLAMFERLADGLGMPDAARVSLGLAPRGGPGGSGDGGSEDSGDRVGLTVAETPDAGVDYVVALWEADMQRRRFLHGAAFTATAFLPPAMTWLVGSTEVEPARAAAESGPFDAVAIREVGAAFRRLDNRYGGGQARSAVVAYLRYEVEPVLRDGKYPTSARRELFAATAELTHLAGWMAYDSEKHALAQRYLIQALGLARQAGDRVLGAEILAAMSQQAIYLDSPREALDLARAARHTADRGGPAVLRAEAFVSEAHAHARLGDEQATATALSEAEAAMDRSADQDVPPWLSYFDEAYLAAKFAHCFRDLGRGDEAVRFARRSLDMDGNYVRGRAFNTALLASAHVHQGDITQAASVGAEALDMASTLRSRRGRRYVRNLADQLRPHGNNSAVRDFQERSRAVLSTGS